METKFIPLDLKADEKGRIEGYGAVFGNADNGGDIVAKGAFLESLSRGRKVKMLYQHDPSQPIGVWDEVKEDSRGLHCKGRILTNTQGGADAYELVKAGALDGLSIGYRTVRASKSGEFRQIDQAELWEVSLVTFPMNEDATIDAWKASEMTQRDLERVLVRDAKLSVSTAKRLMAGGFDALTAKRDAGEGINELADAMRLTLMRHSAR